MKLSFGLLTLLILQIATVHAAWSTTSTPQEFGAKGDGQTDDTAALQASVNAGDVRIPGGTYIIDGPVWVPSFRTIQCEPGAILRNPVHARDGNAIFQWNGTGYGTLTGCTLE